jgi:ABC-type Fe3+-siderophore transport system permease subunit
VSFKARNSVVLVVLLLLVVLVMVWILISALLTTPKECVATIVLILLGLPLYPFFHRRQPRRPSPSPAPTA